MFFARKIAGLLVVAVLPFVVACGHSSTSGAPTAPSSSASGKISGTVIVSAASAPRALLGTATRTLTTGIHLTVTVTGTGISATTDEGGQFTLNNVPAGHVDLHFTANGIDAHLGLDLAQHHKLVIKVRVSDTEADLEDEQDENEQD
jgi:hypothetical protein